MVSTKDDSNQSITNFYRLRSCDPGDPLLENLKSSQDNQNHVPGPSDQGPAGPSGEEKNPAPQIANIINVESARDVQTTSSHQSTAEIPTQDNTFMIAMLDQISKGLHSQMSQMGENLEKKLTKCMTDSTDEIKAKVSSLEVGFQTMESNVEDKIKDLRRDFGEFNSKFDQVDTRFEEAEQRISNLEDRAENSEAVNPEVHLLRSEVNELKAALKLDKCALRKNNLVVNGLPGKNCTMKEAEDIFRNFCEKELKLSREWAQTVVINEIYRFPRKNRELDSWPLFVSLNSLVKKDEIFRAAFNLKGTPYFLRNDLAPHLVEEKKRLIKQRDVLKGAPHHYEARVRDLYNKVWLEYKKEGEERWKTWKEPVN